MDYRQIIQDSLDYIEENLKAELTASELAERAGFSLFHYYRLFQSATGLPVMQYILRRRLLHGIYAIGCGSTGIDAAFCCGFDTYAGFYKAFRREFGCTPSAFLKSCGAKRPYRLNLSKEEPMIVTRKKAVEILRNWGLETEAVSALQDNACRVGDAWMLKFTANLGKMKNHMELSKALGSTGLFAAPAVPTTDGREYVQDGEVYYYVTKRLPGSRMSARALYGDESKARFVGEIIGQLHLALSKVEPPVNDADLFETVKTWALPGAREALGLSDGFCREYLDTFGGLYGQLPRQVIHRDPNPGNMIRSGEKWGFIDFELSERNARIYDPCYAATAVLSESFGLDNEKWVEIYGNILRGYDSVVKLTGAERRAAPYVLLANQLVCVAWFAEQEKYSELFETNKRMTSWLVENFDRLKTW